MDKRLKEAAEQGDIDALYSLIRENPKLLEQIDENPFAQTPLHAATSHGQTKFAKEVMRLKPSFVRKLDEDGFSPIHLALQNGHARMVIQLLEIDRHLASVKGREGRTPLHYAAQGGDITLLSNLLLACPQSIEDVNIRSETALHVALKNDRFEAFEVMVDRWLRGAFHEEDHDREKRVLNWRDEEGHTVLHIAAAKNHSQLLRLLVSRGIDVNSRNLEGSTALDILESQLDSDNEELRKVLCSAGALKASAIPPVHDLECYLRIDKRLKKAAEEGNKDALYALIREDPYLLDRIDQAPFADTPLHIAASAGHTKFALEIMRLKPSFSWKPNRDGYSPIHLALQHPHPPTETILRLLDVDGDLVRVKARESVTPLHYAAERQQSDLLAEFLAACPRSIEDLTIRKETALHVAAKNERLEALEVLIGWLEHSDQNKVLDWADEDGNTVLHIAIQNNLTEVNRYLIGPATSRFLGSVFPLVRILFPSVLLGIKANLNVKNLRGETAIDILKEGQFETKEINAMRRIAKFLGDPIHPAGASDLSGYLRRKMSCLERWAVSDYREKSHMTDENRNAILVVTVLIATATYQAVLSPPGGVWQGDPSWLDPTSSNSNNTLTSTNATNFNPLHMVGRSVMGLDKWTVFSTVNTLAFSISLFKMYRLLPRGPYFVLRLVLPLLLCYALSMIFISPTGWPVVVILFLICSHTVFLKSTVAHVFIYRRKWAVKRLFGKTLSEISNRSGSSKSLYSKRTNSF